MSVAYAVSEQAASSLERQWLYAHVAAQIIGLSAAAAAYGLSRAVGANVAAVAFGLGAELVFAISFAALRGVVLRRVLPAFPLAAWIVAVAAALMLVPVAAALFGAGAAPVPSVPRVTHAMLNAGFGFMVFVGLLFGLLIGAVEALMLRKSALNLGQWVKWSGYAWGGSTVVVYMAGLIVMGNPSLSVSSFALLVLVMKIVQSVLIAGTTWTALEQIEPRVTRSL